MNPLEPNAPPTVTSAPGEIIERRYRMDDGVEIVADVGGSDDAPVIVFLHGGGQTRHSWDAALKAVVNAGYAGINFDARGHGQSGWSPNGDYTATRRAADLAIILADIDRPVALVGASMGGLTAMQAVAENRLPTAAALIMVDIAPRPNPAGVARIAAFMRSRLDGFADLDDAADAVSAYNPHRPRPRDPSGLARNLRLRNGRYYWHWDPRMLDQNVNIEPGADVVSLLDLAANVHIPTLLVRGLNSDVVTDETVKEFQDIVPDLEIFNVAAAGHMVVGDSNEVFNAGVIRFLVRHVPL